MLDQSKNNETSLIPEKRYFTIGEVGELCGVKPHVLRYWEQEFTDLNPVKRKGTRRYYQRHEVLMIQQIKDLLYDQGYTISGAKAHLVSNKSNDKLNNSKQLIREILMDLEGILDLFK